MRREHAALPIALFSVVSLGCQGPAPAASSERPTPAVATGAVPLPSARGSSAMPLEEAIARRRSVRAFSSERLSTEHLAALVWAAQGVTDPDGGGRAAPSAGALYPLEVFALTSDGVFHYEPAGHALARITEDDRRRAIAHAALDQAAASEAPALVVLVGYAARTRGKYGDRADRFVAMEAGHAAQNVLLEATALGLGSVPIGALDEGLVRRALDLGDDATPLYVIPVGHPRR